jgi:hypothetical protein
MTRTYQPKGGMCLSCVHAHADCSALPFAQMPVIGKVTDDVMIVRCVRFERAQEVRR